jgi:hypothetical protein
MIRGNMNAHLFKDELIGHYSNALDFGIIIAGCGERSKCYEYGTAPRNTIVQD